MTRSMGLGVDFFAAWMACEKPLLFLHFAQLSAVREDFKRTEPDRKPARYCVPSTATNAEERSTSKLVSFRATARIISSLQNEVELPFLYIVRMEVAGGSR